MCIARYGSIAILTGLLVHPVLAQAPDGRADSSAEAPASARPETETPARFPPPQTTPDSQASPPSSAGPSDGTGNQTEPSGSTPAPPASPAAETTARLKEQIAARQAQLQASEQSLEPELVKRLSTTYTQALTYLTAVESAETESAKYLEQIAGAAEALSEVNQQIVDFTPSHLREDLTINDLRLGKERLQQLNLALSAATGEVERLEAEQTRRTKRRQEIPVELSRLSAELDELRTADLPSDNGSEALGEAIRWQAEANVLADEAQLKKLERELQTYDSLGSLMPQELALARGVAEDLREAVKIVSQQLESLRSNQIQQAKYDTQELLDRTTDEETAKQVSELLSKIEKWQELAGQHLSVEAEVITVRETLDHWRGRLANMQTLEKGSNQAQGDSLTGGGSFNSWVGLMLRRQLDELPSTTQLAREIRDVDEQLRAARATQFSLQDSQRDVLRSKREIQRLYLSDSTIEDVAKREPAVGQRWEVLLKRESLLAAMKIDVDEFIDSLLQLATTRQQLIDLTYDYRAFIDRHILWIRSAEPIARSDFPSAIEAAQWLCDAKLLQLAKLIASDAARYPWWYALFIGSIGLLVANRTAMLRLIKQLGNEAEKKSCSKFQLTARALLLTALVACPLAIVLLFAHWRLLAISNFDGIGVDAQEYVRAISQGLLAAAWVLFPLAFLRHVCRDGGVGIKHFDWPKPFCELMHHNLAWLLACGLPLVFLVHA
ncbi:MAG TPA: hypothetical protein DDW52_16030, partial [Planctomycetaceae bacterium]|nr:hypothetical protein [Planctomycetaceae bacterium]